jgi:hypothetical protein
MQQLIQDWSYQLGFADGQSEMKEYIIAHIKNNMCFDSLQDPEYRCNNHNGKCYELSLLVEKLTKENN